MKKLAFRFVIYLFLYCAVLPAAAQVPAKVNYQGYLTDAAGTPLGESLVVTFAIYNVEFGGAPLWSDTQFVSVTQGLFSVELGGPADAFPNGLFDTPLWLGVTVAGDAEMLPRRSFATVPYTFQSDNSLMLDGRPPSSFDQASHAVSQNNPHGVTATQVGAADASTLAELQVELNNALATIAQLQAQLDQTSGQVLALQSGATLLSSNLATLEAAVVTESDARIAADENLDTSISALEDSDVLALEGSVQRIDPFTVRFAGVNVEIVNGTNSTAGAPNGRGNLIVGYDEALQNRLICSNGEYESQSACESNNGIWATVHRGGSHNVVVGSSHNYSQYGGIVAGDTNSITGAFASVTAGQSNIAGGRASSVSGGGSNTTTALYASVSGGQQNVASNQAASVSGGANNSATGLFSSVDGGNANTAAGSNASVSGGLFNDANGQFSNVGGGRANDAAGDYAAISGGSGNEAIAEHSSISGGQGNRVFVTAEYGHISGGNQNLSFGKHSHIGGGSENAIVGDYSVVVGGFQNAAGSLQFDSDDPRNLHGVVVGGQNNQTEGQYGVVSGGFSRFVDDIHDWRAGTLSEGQ